MRHSLLTYDVLLVALVAAAILAAANLAPIVSLNVISFSLAGVLAVVILIFSALTMRRILARGARLAYFDELTGLYNRRYFVEVLASLNHENRSRGQMVALLLLDLDRFKLVNDSFGHLAGDELLGVVARRLTRAVGPEGLVARVGGDEFAVVVDINDSDEAMAIAEQLLAGLNQSTYLRGQDIWPNASIGIAVSGTEVGPEELFTRADIALYKAKAQGKGRAFLFEASSPAPLLEAPVPSLASGREEMPESGKLAVYYQPIVDLKSLEVAGAEASLRYERPTHGGIVSQAFRSLADEAGIGPASRRLVIDQAGEQSRAWRERFGEGFSVSLTVPASALRQHASTHIKRRSLRGPGVAANAFAFYRTARSLTAAASTEEVDLAELRRMGFKVAVDGFAIDLSSLNDLQRDDIHFLRLKPDLVRDDDAQRNTRLIRSIVELAHSLGLSVIAEGIETEEHFLRVRRAGCDYGQGHYFAPPMLAEEMTAFLEKSSRLPGAVPQKLALARHEDSPRMMEAG